MPTYTATVIKSGNSYALRVPKRLIDATQLKIGQKVEILEPRLISNEHVDSTEFIEAMKELRKISAELKKHGQGLGMIEGSIAWQRELRKDRPLPGRE